jgi:signal transduction histidine kinase
MGLGIGSPEPAVASPRGLGRPLAAGFVLAVSLLATGVVWTLVGDHDLRVLRADFEYRVRDVVQRIEQRMAAQEQVLRGAAGLFTGTRQVERNEFRDYVASLHIEEHHPGIQGVGISLLVPPDALGGHLRAIRQQGFPTYAIWPPGPRDRYSSIVLVEPFSGRNLRAFGFDMLSEPVRREAMERARGEGLAGIDFVRDRLRALPAPCRAAWRSSAGASLEEVEAVLDDASRGAGQVRDVVADLRSCALGRHAVDARCELASVIQRAVRVASHAVTAGTCVAVDLPPLPPVSGSAPELLQLFVCLLVNAEQSQGEQPNQVRITAEQQGPRVRVRVIDTGRGISSSNLPRVFDPFFTTRMVGQGRGLGLGVARGIAQGLGGDVEVESVEGEGTTVTVTWPVAGGT